MFTFRRRLAASRRLGLSPVAHRYILPRPRMKPVFGLNLETRTDLRQVVSTCIVTHAVDRLMRFELSTWVEQLFQLVRVDQSVRLELVHEFTVLVIISIL